mmetsp:Transcript_8555/g.24546  ORF Transcript_8555/g.24546 Transcript_8555/m.24546 type:complete len:680 (-) Transcript_8555:360-2399(-)|eukprot:CAMPEP_0117664706 /NCGR_PEP_ID=MMETSP0804-20121206/9380_1 /TAXON_ID=1074897 /ORGANISM="Tetraselmis astigmatica, Strain CCMP880" /LENGTH=679 /DNA_ID=CAMNT_0005471991 /DNA_START=188 /DNA_END=2227 /DNA_ORIENTATION=-
MSVSMRPEELLGELSAGEVDRRLKALRQLKNQIIGNKTKKLAYLKLDAVPKVVGILASEQDACLLVQSAAAVGSFSYGVDAGVLAVLDSGGITHLLHMLSHKDDKVVEAAMRSIKMIYQSPLVPQDDIFASPALDSLIAALADPGKLTAEVAACIIARCCQRPEHQAAVVPAKGLEALVPMLGAQRWSSRGAALEALVAITRDNHDTCRALLAYCPKIISKALGLAKEHRPRIQLGACSLLTHLARSSPPDSLRAAVEGSDYTSCAASSSAPSSSSASPDSNVRMAVLPVLMKLLGEPEVREQVPRVLSRLVEGREELQKMAADADAINKLAAFLRDDNCSGHLLEGTLHALGTLCMEREESRKQLMDAKVLAPVASALEHEQSGVREAACLCIRSLSRTVKQQRSALVEADVAAPLLRLLQDPCTEVQLMASATLCNMVLDFSPIKEQVLKNGGAQQLVHLSKSMHSGLRRHAVSALKNLIYQSDLNLKAAVIESLGWPTIKELVEDPEVEVAIEALNMLRNLLHKKAAEIDIVMAAAGGAHEVLALLTEKLDPSKPRPPRLLKEAMCAVSNIATGSEEHKELLLQWGIENHLLRFLQLGGDEHEGTRLSAAWTVINLTYVEGSAGAAAQQGARSRAARLQQAGLRSQLDRMRDDPSQDVQERVQTAIRSFDTLLTEG